MGSGEKLIKVANYNTALNSVVGTDLLLLQFINQRDYLHIWLKENILLLQNILTVWKI